MQEIEETTLTIYLHHTTPEQMAAAYGFTEQQNEHLALLRHEAVSYTHLDVYKRQTRRRRTTQAMYPTPFLQASCSSRRSLWRKKL